MSGEAEQKQIERRRKLLQILKAIGIGAIEGGVIGGLTLVLMLIHDYAIFASLVLWLIAGWVSTYFLEVKTLDIILVSLSGNLVCGLIFFLFTVKLWVIGVIFGISMFFWALSFVTRTFLLPKTPEKEKEELT
ncbi:MAG: hypothetical protein ACTSO7_13280 [Candidatus Heimdallarchaeota archaeon]